MNEINTRNLIVSALIAIILMGSTVILSYIISTTNILSLMPVEQIFIVSGVAFVLVIFVALTVAVYMMIELSTKSYDPYE